MIAVRKSCFQGAHSHPAHPTHESMAAYSRTLTDKMLLHVGVPPEATWNVPKASEALREGALEAPWSNLLISQVLTRGALEDPCTNSPAALEDTPKRSSICPFEVREICRSPHQQVQILSRVNAHGPAGKRHYKGQART